MRGRGLAACGMSALLLVTGACSPREALDPKLRSERLAGDPDASIGDIIDNGFVSDLAEDAEGRTLVAYGIDNGESEGQDQGAWRLYDARGERIADGRLPMVTEAGAHANVFVVPGGFLLSDYAGRPPLLVSPRGETSRVRREEVAEPLAEGDVVLGHDAYRADGVIRPVPIPQDVDASVVDDGGTVWTLTFSAKTDVVGIGRVDAGSGHVQADTIPVPDGAAPFYDLWVSAESVLWVQGRHGGGNQFVATVWHRPVARGGRWTKVPVTGVDQPNPLPVPHLVDGEVLLADDLHGRVWRQTGQRFVEIDLPGEGRARLERQTDQWLVIGTEWDGDAWRAKAPEGHWREVPR